MGEKINTEIGVNEELLIESNKKYGFDMKAEIKKSRKKYAEKSARRFMKKSKENVKNRGIALS